jgi:hypothetical protein
MFGESLIEHVIRSKKIENVRLLLDVGQSNIQIIFKYAMLYAVKEDLHDVVKDLLQYKQ